VTTALLTRRTFVALAVGLLARARAWAQGTPRVRWVWLGACTKDSVTIKARSAAGVELRVSASREGAAGGSPIEGTAVADEQGIASVVLKGLTEQTRYAYTVSGPGSSLGGSFRTFDDGPFSFRVVFASCASTGSLSPVFDYMRYERPDLFIHMGDLHYRNIRANDPGRFADAYDRVLTSRTQAPLFRNTPVAYMWDDHDYGPNDADATSPSRPAALAMYRSFVPHYPMEASSEATIHQAFTIGRVRFLLTDTRSARSPRSVPEAERTMLGREQLAWFLNELEKAADAPLVIWVNTVPWITKANEATIEGWAPYARERLIIAEAIKRRGLTRRLLMLSGDAHMLAIDDGTNSEYATTAEPGAAGFVVAHAAPMDRYPRNKGGPYSHGQVRQNGQFGVLDIVDDGRTVKVTVQGRRGAAPVAGMRIEFTAGEDDEQRGLASDAGADQPAATAVPAADSRRW
jgi:phosphodiesterase/alkaline phosphatase D-like protein